MMGRVNVRKVITKKCKELGLEIKSLDVERRSDAIYGDVSTYSCWMLSLADGGYFETNCEEIEYSLERFLDDLEFHAKEKEVE